jgi:hypothetical protein
LILNKKYFSQSESIPHCEKINIEELLSSMAYAKKMLKMRVRTARNKNSKKHLSEAVKNLCN